MAPTPPRPPWYRRAEAWLIASAIVLPFGWVLPLCRIAWVRVRSRRGAKR